MSLRRCVKGTSRQLRFLEPMLVAWEKNWLTAKHCDPATMPQPSCEAI